MANIIFVEGMHDSFFFLRLLSTFKNFTSADIETCKNLSSLYYYFRNNPRRFIIKKGDEYYILVQGHGKPNASKLFVDTIKEISKTQVNVKSVLLIIDQDTDTHSSDKIMKEITNIQKILTGFVISKPELFRYLSQTSITRGNIHFKAGSLDIQTSLERILGTLIRDHNIIPKNLCKVDDDDVIKNAISHLGVNNFEGLCDYLFSEKHAVMETELNRIGLTETICEFL